MKHVREDHYFKLRLCEGRAGAGMTRSMWPRWWHYRPALLELSEPA
jgi:hypothetical protein